MPNPIRIPLKQGAYQARDVIAAAQRCLNLYGEVNPEGEASPTTYYLTPGLTRLGQPPITGRVRGLYTATNGQLFAAIKNGIYYIAEDFTATLLGTTADQTTPVKMGDNGLDLVIVDGSTSGWSVNLTTHTYAAISDPDFYGSNYVGEMDTFLVFNKPGTPIWYCSDSNAITFDPLYFASKSGYADSLAGLAVRNRNVWLIGTQATSEIWYNAGQTDFPFQIISGPFVQYGTPAIYSIATWGSAVYWLGQNENGTSFVLRGKDYGASKISTPAIDYEISTYSTISDAVGWCYEQAGHAFYWLKFPTAGKDWVFDTTTEQWHERSWQNPDTCENEMHRAFCGTFAYGINIVGDHETGQLYMLDLNNPTDNGDFIERRRGWPHLMKDGFRVSFQSFVADMQAGTATATNTDAGIPQGLASEAVYPTVVTVIDTGFTASNGTLLQNYFIPWGINETGAQFTQIDTTTDIKVQLNRAVGSGTGSSSYLLAGKPTSADYIAQYQVIPDRYDVAPTSGSEVWLLARGNASNLGYKLILGSDGSQYTLSLAVGASTVLTINAGLTTSGYFQLYLALLGDQIKAALQRSSDSKWLTVDGWQTDFAAAFTLTDTTYTAAGNVLIGGVW